MVHKPLTYNLVLSSLLAGWVSTASAITNGTDVPANKYPYFVAIGYQRNSNPVTQKNFPFCGGTLIAPNWVLTAKHCLDFATGPNKHEVEKAKDLKVAIGSSNLDVPDSYKLANISEIHVYDPFLSETIHLGGKYYVLKYNGNDIALLKLDRNISTTVLPSLDYPSSQVALGTLGSVVGNGYVARNTKPLKLQETVMQNIAGSHCITGEGPWHYDFYPALELCLHGDGRDGKRRGSALGDSGGPFLVTQNGTTYLTGLAGHVSWADYRGGFTNPESGFVTYTNILAFKPWINDVTKTQVAQNFPTLPESGTIKVMRYDKHNNLFVGMDSGKVYQLDNGASSSKTLGGGKKVSEKSIFDISIDSDGNLYVVTSDNNIYELVYNTSNWVNLNFKTDKANGDSTYLINTKDNMLYAVTTTGNIYELKSGAWSPVIKFYTRSFYANGQIKSLVKDKNDNLIVGDDKGRVYEFYAGSLPESRYVKGWSLLANLSGPLGTDITAIDVDDELNIFIGTLNKKVYTLPYGSRSWTDQQFDASAPISSIKVLSHTKQLYVGTYDGQIYSLRYQNNNNNDHWIMSLVNNDNSSILNMAIDQNNTLVFSKGLQALLRLTPYQIGS